MRRPRRTGPIWRRRFWRRCGRAMPARGWGGRNWTGAAGGCGGRACGPRRDLEACRVDAAPELDRIVVAVDPPVTGHAGRMNAGSWWSARDRRGRRRTGAPMCWRMPASAAASADGLGARRRLPRWTGMAADRLVAEVNQGGDLVESGDAAGRSAGAVPGGACRRAARWRGPSRWRRFMSRGGCGICAGWARWKTRCAG